MHRKWPPRAEPEGVAAADTLTDRIDALADALRAAGVSPDRMASILASAATATMNALVLDAVLDANASTQPEPVAAPVAEPLKRAA
jgi:hypothetical protein